MYSAGRKLKFVALFLAFTVSLSDVAAHTDSALITPAFKSDLRGISNFLRFNSAAHSPRVLSQLTGRPFEQDEFKGQLIDRDLRPLKSELRETNWYKIASIKTFTGLLLGGLFGLAGCATDSITRQIRAEPATSAASTEIDQTTQKAMNVVDFADAFVEAINAHDVGEKIDFDSLLKKAMLVSPEAHKSIFYYRMLDLDDFEEKLAAKSVIDQINNILFPYGLAIVLDYSEQNDSKARTVLYEVEVANGIRTIKLGTNATGKEEVVSVLFGSGAHVKINSPLSKIFDSDVTIRFGVTRNQDSGEQEPELYIVSGFGSNAIKMKLKFMSYNQSKFYVRYELEDETGSTLRALAFVDVDVLRKIYKGDVALLFQNFNLRPSSISSRNLLPRDLRQLLKTRSELRNVRLAGAALLFSGLFGLVGCEIHQGLTPMPPTTSREMSEPSFKLSKMDPVQLLIDQANSVLTDAQLIDVIEEFSQHHDIRITNFLKKFHIHPNSDVRIAAFRALLRTEDLDSISVLSEMLSEKELYDQYLVKLLSYLGQKYPALPQEHLNAFLNNQPTEEAIRAIGETQNSRAILLLIRMIQTVKPDYRDVVYRGVRSVLSDLGEKALQVLVPLAVNHWDYSAGVAINILHEDVPTVDFTIEHIRNEIVKDRLNVRPKLREALDLLLQCKELNIKYPFRYASPGYEHDILKKLIVDRMNPQPDGRKLAVIVLPRSDWNTAFTNRQAVEAFFKQNYRVMYYEASSRSEVIQNTLEATGSEEAHIIVWGAHASATSMSFGGPDPVSRPDPFGRRITLVAGESFDISLKDLDELQKSGIASRLRSGGHVILMACSAGEGRDQNDNLANMIRKIFQNASHIWSTALPAPLPTLKFNETGDLIYVEFKNGEEATTYISGLIDMSKESGVVFSMAGFSGASAYFMAHRSELREEQESIGLSIRDVIRAQNWPKQIRVDEIPEIKMQIDNGKWGQIRKVVSTALGEYGYKTYRTLDSAYLFEMTHLRMLQLEKEAILESINQLKADIKDMLKKLEKSGAVKSDRGIARALLELIDRRDVRETEIQKHIGFRNKTTVVNRLSRNRTLGEFRERAITHFNALQKVERYLKLERNKFSIMKKILRVSYQSLGNNQLVTKRLILKTFVNDSPHEKDFDWLLETNPRFAAKLRELQRESQIRVAIRSLETPAPSIQKISDALDRLASSGGRDFSLKRISEESKLSVSTISTALRLNQELYQRLYGLKGIPILTPHKHNRIRKQTRRKLHRALDEALEAQSSESHLTGKFYSSAKLAKQLGISDASLDIFVREDRQIGLKVIKLMYGPHELLQTTPFDEPEPETSPKRPSPNKPRLNPPVAQPPQPSADSPSSQQESEEEDIVAFTDAFDANGRHPNGSIFSLVSASPAIRKKVVERIASAAPPGSRVLSIAEGRGHLARDLMTHGFQVKAIDLSPKNTRIAKEERGVDQVTGNAYQLPEDFRNFDAVIINEAIGNLRLSDTLSEAAKALKPGGKIIITTYSPDNYGDDSQNTKYVPYRVEEIRAELQKSGFQQLTDERIWGEEIPGIRPELNDYLLLHVLIATKGSEARSELRRTVTLDSNHSYGTLARSQLLRFVADQFGTRESRPSEYNSRRIVSEISPNIVTREVGIFLPGLSYQGWGAFYELAARFRGSKSLVAIVNTSIEVDAIQEVNARLPKAWRIQVIKLNTTQIETGTVREIVSSLRKKLGADVTIETFGLKEDQLEIEKLSRRKLTDKFQIFDDLYEFLDYFSLDRKLLSVMNDAEKLVYSAIMA